MQRFHQAYSCYSSWKEIPLIASAAAAFETFHEVALVMSAQQASHTSVSAKSGSASGSSDGSGSPPKISEADLKNFFVQSSESSDDDLCGPHQDCCGGALREGVYTTCVKRLGKGGYQHPRGQVCLSLHKHFQCATCQNVAHHGCWVRTAKGSFMLPSSLTQFHCFTCASKKDQHPAVQAVSSAGTAQPPSSEVSTEQSSLCTDALTSCTVQPSLVQETERTRTFMSESDLRRHFKKCNWQVSHSTETRIYYKCMVTGGCNVTFSAKKGSDNDTWRISNMPTSHSCSAFATPQVNTSMVTMKDNLSEAAVKEIERLGITKSFRSKQIQHHLLHQDNGKGVLVDTKLIHNIVYRVRQKLFGHQADMIYLLDQQKVPFM
jgi:hypothetical protein